MGFDESSEQSSSRTFQPNRIRDIHNKNELAAPFEAELVNTGGQRYLTIVSARCEYVETNPSSRPSSFEGATEREQKKRERGKRANLNVKKAI